ncbi:MAG: hypothetical protein K6F86_05000 [Lachnospiraceae bacterium]|nr:hypothetical protein [Lachnospiraceae bacterium]
MNAFLNRIERKFGRYSVPQLTKFIILTYIIGYLLYFTEALTHVKVLSLIYLSPRLIISGGQVWRIFTWIFMPPTRPDIFTVIMLFFYYRIGTALEQTWGDFRYNLYIFSGLFFMLAGAFVLYFFGINVDGMFTTYYITMSIFLAFAACYPDMQVLLYFLIPLKIKYLAFLDVGLIAVNAIYATVPERLAIVFSLLNFVIFFFTTRNYKSISPAERARKNNFRRAMEQGPYHTESKGGPGFFSETKQSVNYNAGETMKKGQISKHKCAICGRTEIDHPELEFRFCSKCEGNYEYCNDHLFTHKHIKV